MKHFFLSFFCVVCLFSWTALSASADSDNMLILINASHPLPDQYAEQHKNDLVEVKGTRADGRPVQLLQKEAAEALESLLAAAADAGFSDLSVTSAYRSRAYQKQLFDAAVQKYLARGMTAKDARRLAARYHALPGESEHESGLAVDLHNLPAASTAFADTDAFRWLAAHAPEYGFILRYPEGKEKITGIAFEPWHFRSGAPMRWKSQTAG